MQIEFQDTIKRDVTYQFAETMEDASKRCVDSRFD